MVCIANPGAPAYKPAWFKGTDLQLWFGDVFSEADAAQYKTRAPDMEDIRQGVEFLRRAWALDGSKVMVSCDYGASRSPALAYLFLADILGPGHEAEAFKLTLDLRPVAIPNTLVVSLGDTFLKRQGALLRPLKDFNARLSAELFK